MENFGGNVNKNKKFVYYEPPNTNDFNFKPFVSINTILTISWITHVRITSKGKDYFILKGNNLHSRFYRYSYSKEKLQW